MEKKKKKVVCLFPVALVAHLHKIKRNLEDFKLSWKKKKRANHSESNTFNLLTLH